MITTFVAHICVNEIRDTYRFLVPQHYKGINLATQHTNMAFFKDAL